MCAFRPCANHGVEPIATARNRLDDPLLAVVEYGPQLVHALRQRIVAHHDARPQGIQQLLLPQHLTGAAREVQQQRKGLRAQS